jgi:hypothetical protein
MGAREVFHTWLRVWPPHSRVWIGDKFDSGRPCHALNFRPVAEWDKVELPPGNFTCGSSFVEGAYSRCDSSIAERVFLVVESDTLGHDAVGAVFRYVNRRLRYRLHCVIDSGGKSLHGWFSPPPEGLEPGLKAFLGAMGCDTRLFVPSQPARVPGAMRGDRLQRLLWVEEGGRPQTEDHRP